MLRTGSAAGRCGPTIFLVKGQRVRQGFTTKFIMKYGAAIGSRIIANKNAYMDTETWLNITPAIIEGYRTINPHALATPNWWMIEIIDGFGAHLASGEAMKLRYDAKILTVKEEGDTLHVCQAYDAQVAKSDKRNSSEAISVMKNTSFHYDMKIIDQYGLVLAGLHAIKCCTPDVWIKSFRKVHIYTCCSVLCCAYCFTIP